ncbi:MULTISPECIES: AAA family ATPase [Pseudonocardia]|uniref:Chloramphenicol phosphotransferase-like protein n=2 Tax=Pseudonocardia TaxID=1847 RepID=A0A1Y2NB66_PSEAH|nr:MULTISPECIES: AAA family ATPase [Pseudonocardia]OSY44138.1 Chloramphenicol phosphotransferase-like protein [Pseudonocardia autotrophica]TDN74132.1 chloramphenicol 3-O-phosphotransferase [Pseudonocardia autotrophica]BBG04891.1 hypothetical protein Pdca_61000 [Pseudonocardia autotrophica]GEC23547.1 hypothetical protein PSA01_05760 [Pseudonocardia saturnea]
MTARPAPRPAPATYLITGIQAAGKSSVAQALATRLPAPAVHVHGDQFRRWIVTGRADMSPDPTTDAIDQLRLRHRITAATCDQYAGAGFHVVAQDVLLGPHLRFTVDLISSRPLHVVVLAPSPDAIAGREAGRAKDSYDRWTIEQLDHGLRHETPRIGLWLDSSDLGVDETVDAILARHEESLVARPEQ